ncbi:hypothetical protein Fmac_025319 [Flemingia macrophylla]|uniref:Uncharacterized protein n=1 Tax=Flemingia macrophylla TaxID=520843 RepID=A0ABD1LRW0_9FABA
MRRGSVKLGGLYEMEESEGQERERGAREVVREKIKKMRDKGENDAQEVMRQNEVVCYRKK